MMNSTVEKIKNAFATPVIAFNNYADMVYRLAFVRTKNKSDSDDILQEVFMRYIKVWKKMESEEHVKAMLIRITVNCSNTLLSSSWFKRTLPLDETLPYFDNGSDGEVLKAVINLPQKYRTVIHLYYYCGYSVNEIGEILNLKTATVKTHLNRARETLKNNLKRDDF